MTEIQELSFGNAMALATVVMVSDEMGLRGVCAGERRPVINDGWGLLADWCRGSEVSSFGTTADCK